MRLSKTQQITLKEEGDSAISVVSSAAISPNGNFLVITDSHAGNVAVFRVSEGTLRNFISTSSAITDSLAFSGVSSWATGSYSSLADTRRNNPQALKELRNSYAQAVFESDSTLAILGDVRALFLPQGLQGDLSCYIAHRMFIERMNLSGQPSRVIFPDEKRPETTFARRGILLLDGRDGGYIVSVGNQDAVSRGRSDSAPTIALYDFTGKRKSNLSFIPEEFQRSSLGYNYLQPVGAVDSSGEIVIGYALTSKFTELKSAKTIEIPAITSSNKAFFSSVTSKSKGGVKQFDVDLTNSSCIRSVEVTERGYFSFIVQHGTGDEAKREAIEFSPSGDLVREAAFPDLTTLGSIRHISYHASLKGFLCLSISREGKLIMSIFRWS